MKSPRAFTLIELLVVIAIIGLLAAVVLASLSTARGKGTDARVEQELNSMRSAAEIFYNDTKSYGTVGSNNGNAGLNCGTTGGPSNSSLFSYSTSNMAGLVNEVTTAVGGAGNIDCGVATGGSAWSIAAQLPSTLSSGVTSAFFCIDSTGYAGTTLKGTATPYAHLTVGSQHAHAGAGDTACN